MSMSSALALADYAVVTSTKIFPPAIASSFWLTNVVFTCLFVALTALFYHLFAGRLSEILSRTRIYVPWGRDGKREINIGRNIRNLIPATGGNVWWQLFNRSVSDLNLGSENTAGRVLRRKLTSIGRFSLRSQSERNPCIISFFLAFSNKRGKKRMDLTEMESVWRKRVMDKHERFRSRICDGDDRFFEVVDEHFDLYAKEVPHPGQHRFDLNNRIGKFLTSSLNVNKRLWEAKISTGTLGSSGAISNSQIESRNLQLTCDTETVALFRIHHALADGVSMGVALGDSADEAEDLKYRMMSEIEKRSHKPTSMTFAQKLEGVVLKLAFYILGGIKAIALQAWRSLTAFSPFDSVLSQSSIPPGRRSTTWMTLASTQEIKRVAKTISKSATLNDVSVSIVTEAIRKQLIEHQKLAETFKNNEPEGVPANQIVIPSRVNVTIPVHLHGGVLLPGESIGNKIGAFVTSVPLSEGSYGKYHRASSRLECVSKALGEGKSTPAPLIAWSIAKFVSDYTPDWFAKWVIQNGNAKSVCVVSNIKGFPFKVHWMGRRLEFLCAFLPLPPGIPIGVVVSSYDGEVAFTVDADQRAVPDADRFGKWMIEEFRRLQREAEAFNKQN